MNRSGLVLLEMVLRIEKIFGVKMGTLLRMQTRYDAHRMHQREKGINVRRYAYSS